MLYNCAAVLKQLPYVILIGAIALLITSSESKRLYYAYRGPETTHSPTDYHEHLDSPVSHVIDRQRDDSAQLLEVGGKVGFTVVLLAGALFVILANKYTPTDKHWAYATIGTLIGYWLKG
jgi:hypothetical protein